MSLIDLYPAIRLSHITLVLVSGSLFAVRGLAVLAGARWAVAAWARRLSVVIDSSLLAAAVLLLVALRLNPFTTPWLQVKLLLLVAYVLLGTLALKRARTRSTRALCYLAAVACFCVMVSVARTHHPLGVFMLR